MSRTTPRSGSKRPRLSGCLTGKKGVRRNPRKKKQPISFEETVAKEHRVAPSPSVYDAQRIPESSCSEIERLLWSGDLFRYHTLKESPVAKLEHEFAELMDVPFALATTSCSTALFLSLRALDIPVGSKVLTPAFTFAAVPSAIVLAGCQPVLVEVGQNYRIDIQDFVQKLGEGAEAVIISHMRGHTSDMDAIMRLCEACHVPVIEDAAHSMGTLWNGCKVGTIGKLGCFSFQSYKLINAGEGGMLITRDPEIFARAVIMSGAYEHNWKQHASSESHFRFWQNKLPLYNTRMNNLSAVVARSQLAEVPHRIRKARANYDYVAGILETSQWLQVPSPLVPEIRAPDSIQFNLINFSSDMEVILYQEACLRRGVSIQIFGLSEDNARAFWNWQFISVQRDLPLTRAMLMRACDVRLPVNLKKAELRFIADALVKAAEDVKGSGEKVGKK